MIHSIPIVFDMLRIISKICPWLLRGYYTREKLDALIKLDVSSSGERISYYFTGQESMCYLTATNLSPFDFIIDRMVISVVVEGGAHFTCVKVLPDILKATGTQTIFARGHSPMLPDVAQRAKDSKRASIEIDAYIVSSIHSFLIKRQLSDVTGVKISS
jgi:hypothetical protein